MNYRLTFSALACLAQAQAQNSDQPVINTPASVVQCLPSLLTFNGGSPPYTITAIPAGQVGAAPLADLGTQTGTSFTWNVSLPAGTGITLQIRDSRGVINYSQAVTIQPNSDSSCLNSKGGNSNPSTPTPTSASPAAATGTSSVTPPTNPSGATINSTSSAHPNATAPVTGFNSTTTTPSSSSAATNQTKAPSIFSPNNSNASNSSSASTNAPNSAASGTFVYCKGLVAGLAIVGVSLTLLA